MTVNYTIIGLITGLLFAVCVAAGGWLGFFVAIIFAAIGIIIGMQFDGRIDLQALIRSKGRG